MTRLKTTETMPFADVTFAPSSFEQVEDGIKFEYRRGYHLDAQRNAQIPAIFRRHDGFYHWHSDSAIVGFFILSRANKEMKGRALMIMLNTHKEPCRQFGLTHDHLEALLK